ncbi:hypothetical protein P3T76_014660 [Phytophthora citrophthora]|uniref:Carbohydrate-binding protein n=1 Tax=Phytophthora citrophthora TaxID=4793 RepID=A0AAD9LC15_9STRA|nr:hypothetical protein P3T76_014660 [Phytophthora citrophthora]
MALRLSLFVALGASYALAVEVSVCRDATYEISVDATSLCAGSGSEPAGWSCPKAGDVAVADCLSTLVSYGSGTCVAPEDAECRIVNGDTWGCVLPSVGCNDVPEVEEPKCETWDYSGDDTVDSSGSSDEENYDEGWFTQTTKIRELYNCGHKPTPAPTTATPEPTPAATTETPEPTPAATETNTTETPAATPTPAPTSTETPSSSPTPAPTECSGSASAVADVGVTEYGGTQVGDEESAAGTATTVTFATIDDGEFGGLSNAMVAVIAAVGAFVAIVVAVVAVVYARKRHVKEDLEEGEEDASVDEEDNEDEDKESESDLESASPVVPPTPAVVSGKMATTPTAAAVTAKVTTPTTTSAEITSSSGTVSKEDDDEASENADTGSSKEAVAAKDD